MTSERYAAGDDAFKAVIDHAPNKESTNLSGLVADARARRTQILTISGQLPQVVPSAANSLSPDIDTLKPMVVERIQDGETTRSDQTAAADAQPAEPRARLEPPLT